MDQILTILSILTRDGIVEFFESMKDSSDVAFIVHQDVM